MQKNNKTADILEMQKKAYEENFYTTNEIFHPKSRKTIILPIILILSFIFIFSLFCLSIMDFNLNNLRLW